MWRLEGIEVESQVSVGCLISIWLSILIGWTRRISSNQNFYSVAPEFPYLVGDTPQRVKACRGSTDTKAK